MFFLYILLLTSLSNFPSLIHTLHKIFRPGKRGCSMRVPFTKLPPFFWWGGASHHDYWAANHIWGVDLKLGLLRWFACWYWLSLLHDKDSFCFALQRCLECFLVSGFFGESCMETNTWTQGQTHPYWSNEELCKCLCFSVFTLCDFICGGGWTMMTLRILLINKYMLISFKLYVGLSWQVIL